ncbi:MAG: cytidylyltransferase domain-containing protein [Petrotogales bacterium]
MKRVAFIPIRMNSKRVKNKNVRVLKGRPLFCWAAETLDKLNIPVYIYTNSEDILSACLDFNPRNITFLHRPEHLDSDKTKGIDIYQQFAKDIPADIYLLAHCTSPFVSENTYRVMLDSVKCLPHKSALTVEKIQTFAWYEKKPLNFELPRIQTQLLKPVIIETSAAYVYKRDVVEGGTRSCDFPKLVETKYPETIDIDTEEDLRIAEDVKL